MKSLIKRASKLGIHPKTLLAMDEFEAAIAEYPKDASAYANMGRWWHINKNYYDALSHLNTALEYDTNHFWARCSRSDLCATCPNDLIRNGKKAIDDAKTAIKIAKTQGMLDGAWRERMLNPLLAAAYAEDGQFHQAIEIENESMKIATTKSAARTINEHLQQYRLNKPIRSETGIAR